MFTMNHPRLIVSDQMEECISIQRVNHIEMFSVFEVHDSSEPVHWDFGTYHIVKQRRLRPTSCCLHTQNMDVDEDANQKLNQVN